MEEYFLQKRWCWQYPNSYGGRSNKNVSNSYNVLHDDGISLRGTFVIDEEFILRHLSVNDLPIGRNIDEVPKQIQYR